MFNTVYESLTGEDKYALKYFSILPSGSYTLAKIIQWFGLSAEEIDLTKKSVSVLTAKGILIEKNGVYSVRTGIRKEMEQNVVNLYADQILKLSDRFIKEIKLLPEEKDVFQSRLNLNVIDGFVNSEILKSNKGSLNLRKSLADYYLAIGTPEYIARAEKILTSFEFDPDNIDLATSLAKVYFEMYKMMKNDKENELYVGEGRYYLSKAKSLLDDFPDNPFHAMSKEMVLKLWISYEQQDNYKKVKDDIESIIRVFDDEYFSDDIRYNIFVLSEYLALGKLTSQGTDYMKKVHNCLIRKEEDATGPESVGYITRKLNYCQYLDKIKEDAILKEMLNEISPIIDRFSKEENLEDQESANKQFLVSEFVNFSVSLRFK